MKNKIVFVSGQFNILHPGHVRLLSYAKKLGNKLIVGVLSDKLSARMRIFMKNLGTKMSKQLHG